MLKNFALGLSCILALPFGSAHAENSFTEVGLSTTRYSLTQSTGKQFQTHGQLYGLSATRTTDAPFLNREATQTWSGSYSTSSSLQSSYVPTSPANAAPLELANSTVRLARLSWQGELNDIFTSMAPAVGLAADYESHRLGNEGSSNSYYPLVNKALIARLALKSAPSAGYPGTLAWELGIEYPLWSQSKIGLVNAKQSRDLVRTVSLSYQITNRLSLKTSYTSSTRFQGPSTSFSISGRDYTEQIAATRTEAKSISLLYAF